MTPAVTHLCCQECRLRFTLAATAYLGACPECGEPLRESSLRGMVGFRVFRLEDLPPSLPQAVAAALPVPSAVERARQVVSPPPGQGID